MPGAKKSPSPPPATGSPGAGEAGLETVIQDTVQVDEDSKDDPGFGDDDSIGSASFVSSINSSILNYKYENGRRYHAYREGTYLYPNDDDEQGRMDLCHHIYSMCLGGELHLAPIGKNPQRVLDLGTGIWAMDFADEYSSAEVIGTDLSSIQPKWTPPNCSFEVDDFEQEWMFRRKFDYIHIREIGGCITDDVALFRRAYDSLNPGGYFEIQTAYASFDSDDGTDKGAKDAKFWAEQCCVGTAKHGKPFDLILTFAEKMRAVGFADVKQEIRKLPVGPWPMDPVLKEIGRFQLVQQIQAVDSYTPGIFERVLGWKAEEASVLMAKVKQDLRNPKFHLYVRSYFIWGRKP